MQRSRHATKGAVAVAGGLLLWILGSGIVPARVSASAHAAQTAGTTYDVAATGDDANPCTLAAPCASLGRATSLTQPGDTVLVEAGVYGPQTIVANGTPDAPITVTTNGPVTLIRPLPLTDASQSAILLRVANSSYLRVTGFHVVGAKAQPGYVSADQPYGGEVEVENHDPNQPGYGLVLSNLTVEHANNSCIKIQDSEPDVTIAGNTVLDCGRPGETLDHGIYVSGPGALIQGNTVSGSSGYGIHAHGPVAGAQIIGNTVTGAYYAGIIDDNPPSTISDNVVYRNGADGIVVSRQDTSLASIPVTVTDNVIISNGSSGVFLGNGGGGASVGGQTIANNTFYRNGGRDLYVGGGQVTGPITVANDIFDDDPARYFSPYLSVASFTPPGSSVFDHNLYDNVMPIAGCNGPASCDGASYDGGHSLRAVDPQFLDAALLPVPDLRLSPGSQAVGIGMPLPGVTSGQSANLGAPCSLCATQAAGSSQGDQPTAPATSTNTPTDTSTSTSMPTDTSTATPTSTSTPAGADTTTPAGASSATVAPVTTPASTATPTTPAPSPTRATMPVKTPVATATRTPGRVPTAVPTGTATPRPATTATPAHRGKRARRHPPAPKLALHVDLSAFHVRDGGVLTIRSHTYPHVTIRAALDIAPRQVASMGTTPRHGHKGLLTTVVTSVAVAHVVHGTSDSHGVLNERLRIHYRATRVTRATLFVVATTPSGRIVRAFGITIQPGSFR